jgi:hypothetical protein
VASPRTYPRYWFSNMMMRMLYHVRLIHECLAPHANQRFLEGWFHPRIVPLILALM